MNVFKTLWSGVRSAVFLLGFVLTTLVYIFILPLLFFLPYSQRYSAIIKWCGINLHWLQIACGVEYRLLGKENIPTDGAAIIMSNHQSTWETLALPHIFPPLTLVVKKELFRIPVFGWGLKMIRPVGIDRSAGRNAIEQVKVQGKDRLDEGISIVIFPEGTRVKPGVKVRYRIGGAALASYTGYPVVPVAHNAGMSWPRQAFIKKAGVVTMSVGKPIKTRGRSPEEILQEVEQWIEAEKARLIFEEK